MTPLRPTVKATLPGNIFTKAVSVSVTIYIDQISGVLNFKWVPSGAGNQGGLAENKPFSLVISDGASGGQLPYTWKLLSGPTDTGLSLVSNADGTEAKI